MRRKYENKKWYLIYKKVVSILGWIVLAILGTIGILLLFVLINTKTAEAKGEKPVISLYTIISGSMEETINVYDVVVVKSVNTNNLKKGDIISFFSTSDFFGNTPITHRIHSVYKDNNEVSYVTKGDANPEVDNSLVTPDRVIGKVIFKIPALGRIQFYLVQKAGWIFALVIPALIIIIYDAIKLTKLIKVRKKMAELNVLEEKKERDNDSII